MIIIKHKSSFFCSRLTANDDCGLMISSVSMVSVGVSIPANGDILSEPLFGFSKNDRF